MADITCHASTKTIGSLSPGKGGRSLLARELIRRNEVIAVFGGRAMTLDEVRALPGEQCRLLLQVDDNSYLLSEQEGPADWINHCCEPNAGMRGQIVLVAMRDIQAGEEICFDYAMTDGSDYDEFHCGCGSGYCRGRVTGDDWKLPELWERYAGYFSPYLSRRIETMRRQLPVAEPRRRRARRRG